MFVKTRLMLLQLFNLFNGVLQVGILLEELAYFAFLLLDLVFLVDGRLLVLTITCDSSP